MKKLFELYPNTASEAEIKDIKINSRDCGPGDLFVCTMGATADRHDFVRDAVEHGVSAIVASRNIDEDAGSVPVVYVENTNEELPLVAQRLFDHPEKELTMTAITGTNGKTTVATMIADMIGMNECGTIGTTGIRCEAFDEPIVNSCPDADRLYKYLRRFADSGVKTVTMEATSEALVAGRLNKMAYDAVIFTNITRDHRNAHGTIENYVAAKLMLLDLVKPDGVVILNVDDEHYEEELARAKNRVLTFGKSEDADLVIKEVKENADGICAIFSYKGCDTEVSCPLGGEYNAYNLAAAFLYLLDRGFDAEYLSGRAALIKPVPGRTEYLSFGQDFDVVLDYAHTPDALDKICSYLRRIADERGKRLLTLTGSAGGRDADKRGDMGKVVLSKSDQVVFTMDDPRNESVDDIIDDLIGDWEKENYVRIIDRKAAIELILDMANEGDVVLIAGKGRDNYMAIGNEYVPYSDYDSIKEILEK